MDYVTDYEIHISKPSYLLVILGTILQSIYDT